MKTFTKISFVFALISNIAFSQHHTDWTGFEFWPISGDVLLANDAIYQLQKDYTIGLSEYFLDAEKLPETSIGDADLFYSWAQSLPPCEWDFISLESGGILTIKQGYRWDGASNPIDIDGQHSFRSSIIHDALYDLMRMGYLNHDVGLGIDAGYYNRKMTDMLHYMIAIEDGDHPTGVDGAESDYLVLRAGGASATHDNKKLTKWKYHVSELTAIASDGKVKLKWVKPNAAGRDPNPEDHFVPITGYKIRRNGGDIATLTFSDWVPNEDGWITSFEDTDVVYGTAYSYQVLPLTVNTNLYDWSNVEHVVPVDGAGNALYLDGIDDYVEANTVCNDLCYEIFPTPGASLTFEAWIYPKEQTGRTAILAFNTISGGNFNQMFYDGDENRFYYYDDDNHYLASMDVFPSDDWYHVAVTIDETNSGVLYVNGTEQLTFSTDIKPLHGGRFSIGQDWDDSNTSQHFKGVIDEVRVWSLARTLEQIEDNMYTQLLGDETGLVSLWHFDEPNDYFVELDFVPVNLDPTVLASIRRGFDASSNANDGMLVGYGKLDTALIASGAMVPDTSTTSIIDHDQLSPFSLHQICPNPFSSFTEIQYYIPQNENVQVAIFDMLGRRVKILVNKPHQLGEHAVSWNGTNQNGTRVENGIYYCRIMVGDYCNTSKILLIK
jgi:hypothetical protein